MWENPSHVGMTNLSMDFCTIVTQSHLPYAYALHESLLDFSADVKLHVFLSDQEPDTDSAPHSGILTYSCRDLCSEGMGKKLYDRYYANHHDCFRWSMKSVFLKRLLEQGKSRVIYVDCDIHFFNDYSFLFDLLEENSMVLSPHNRTLDPNLSPKNFQLNFTEGIYNGGFIGVNENAIPILDWWAKACLFRCEKSPIEGFFVDQKYLDLIPARFAHVHSLQHLGCNIAEWNRDDCKRIRVDDKVLINGRFPVVFIHFTMWLMVNIWFFEDSLLKPHLQLYIDRLRKYDSKIDLEKLIHEKYSSFSQGQSNFTWLQALGKKIFG